MRSCLKCAEREGTGRRKVFSKGLALVSEARIFGRGVFFVTILFHEWAGNLVQAIVIEIMTQLLFSIKVVDVLRMSA